MHKKKNVSKNYCKLSCSLEARTVKASHEGSLDTRENNQREALPLTIADKCQRNVQDKTDFLDYLIQDDGRVMCKICKEILSSRTHWYRHKYKIHNPSNSSATNPSALFNCDQCNAYFKSRKGFIGHLASRHTSEAQGCRTENIASKEQSPESIDNKTSVGNSWDEQRKRDEKLVEEIIDRVRRECEAQGATISRKGYNRRTTVMNTS
ncbi:hypothetical protein DMENIID0001_033890 [Sergentomyia squamirostris]